RTPALTLRHLCIALPFPGTQIGPDFGLAQPYERDLALDPAQHQPAVWAHQCDSAVHPVTASREQPEARPCARLVLGLRQDTPAAGNDGVRRQDIGAGMARDYRPRLFLRETHSVCGRQLAAAGGLVD